MLQAEVRTLFLCPGSYDEYCRQDPFFLSEPLGE